MSTKKIATLVPDLLNPRKAIWAKGQAAAPPESPPVPKSKLRTKLVADLVKSRNAGAIEDKLTPDKAGAHRGEAAPDERDQSKLFFTKGGASASAFRPDFWSYDPSRKRDAEHTVAAECPDSERLQESNTESLCDSSAAPPPPEIASNEAIAAPIASLDTAPSDDENPLRSTASTSSGIDPSCQIPASDERAACTSSHDELIPQSNPIASSSIGEEVSLSAQRQPYALDEFTVAELLNPDRETYGKNSLSERCLGHATTVALAETPELTQRATDVCAAADDPHPGDGAELVTASDAASSIATDPHAGEPHEQPLAPSANGTAGIIKDEIPAGALVAARINSEAREPDLPSNPATGEPSDHYGHSTILANHLGAKDVGVTESGLCPPNHNYQAGSHSESHPLFASRNNPAQSAIVTSGNDDSGAFELETRQPTEFEQMAGTKCDARSPNSAALRCGSPDPSRDAATAEAPSEVESATDAGPSAPLNEETSLDSAQNRVASLLSSERVETDGKNGRGRKAALAEESKPERPITHFSGLGSAIENVLSERWYGSGDRELRRYERRAVAVAHPSTSQNFLDQLKLSRPEQAEAVEEGQYHWRLLGSLGVVLLGACAYYTGHLDMSFLGSFVVNLARAFP